MRMAVILSIVSVFAASICSANGKPDLAVEGQPVDISPWTYVWRADRSVQKVPEAYFIPRRLDRIDRVYRTAYHEMSPEELKSIYYDMPDLLKPLPPAPKGKLLTGMLWIGGLNDYQLQLYWPKNKPIPSQESIEVRSYPTSFGWFGWTVDRILSNPGISADGLVWTYKSDPSDMMDSAYSVRVPARTEMIAVFSKHDGVPVPEISITGNDVGKWSHIDIEMEWGFLPEMENKSFDGRLETYVSQVIDVSPLSEDHGTSIYGTNRWSSQYTGDMRRGIRISALYAPNSRLGLDSRFTVWMGKSGFTFRISDLQKGPIYIPQHGIFITKTGTMQTARGFLEDLTSKNMKSIRQMVREHREASSWDELMQQVRFWRCPEGTPIPPFPKVPDPPMSVEVTDQRWTDMWRIASDQLRGPHLWPTLGHEIGRTVRDMELVGLHDDTLDIYQYFLSSPGVKSDGDYTDGIGSLEWAKSMRHDMGYSHEGTHASTGRLLFAMSDRYFLSGDREFFERNRTRLQAAADWIIRQKNSYMKDIPNRDKLFVAGLMPPCMLGDYALPASDWHWYYCDNALSLQGLQRFADALMDFDQAAGKKYQAEADTFRKDILRVVHKEAALSPVRLGRDGMYHTYIPRMAYARGLTGPELGAPQFPDCDLFWGSLALGEKFAAIDANDYRMVDTIDMTEEMGTSDKAIRELEEARRKKGMPVDDSWFWLTYSFLPKISHNANIYLLQDDVPNFLRFWMNSYAGMVGANGRLWEHWHLDSYTDCDVPDTMTAGWFIENFRNMLVMEDDHTIWIARGTPRAWLNQGGRISVKDAPTYFGPLAYEIISDVNNGKISAVIDVPGIRPVKNVIVRFRHPNASLMTGVTVNGKQWKSFDGHKEIIEIKGLTGKIEVVASYK